MISWLGDDVIMHCSKANGCKKAVTVYYETDLVGALPNWVWGSIKYDSLPQLCSMINLSRIYRLKRIVIVTDLMDSVILLFHRGQRCDEALSSCRNSKTIR